MAKDSESKKDKLDIGIDIDEARRRLNEVADADIKKWREEFGEDKESKEQKIDQPKVEPAKEETNIGKSSDTVVTKKVETPQKEYSPEDKNELDFAKSILNEVYGGEKNVIEFGRNATEEKIPEVTTTRTKEEVLIELENLPEKIQVEKDKDTRKNLEKQAEELFEDLTEKNLDQESKERAKIELQKAGDKEFVKVKNFRHSTGYQERVGNAQHALEKEQKQNAMWVFWKNLPPEEKKPEYFRQEGNKKMPTKAFWAMFNKKISDSGLSQEVFYILLNRGYQPDKMSKAKPKGFWGFFSEPKFSIPSSNGKSDIVFEDRDEYNTTLKKEITDVNKRRAAHAVETLLSQRVKLFRQAKKSAMVDVIKETVENYKEEQQKLEEQQEKIKAGPEKPKRGHPAKSKTHNSEKPEEKKGRTRSVEIDGKIVRVNENDILDLDEEKKQKELEEQRKRDEAFEKGQKEFKEKLELSGEKKDLTLKMERRLEILKSLKRNILN